MDTVRPNIEYDTDTILCMSLLNFDFETFSHLLALIIQTGTNTAIFDYCAEGTIDDMLEDDDQKFMSTWTPKHVLRYAWQISKALADVHR